MPIPRWLKPRAGVGGARPVRAAPDRPFGIGDGLILVAATAAGLGLTRAVAPALSLDDLWEFLTTPPRGLWDPFYLDALLELVVLVLTPMLMAWTPACLLMRLRSPRPSRRRLARQPGAMACLFATSVCAIEVGFLAARLAWDADSYQWPRDYFKAVLLGSFPLGAAVATCWATLILGGRWAPEPTWIDRLGRLLGATWLVVVAFFGLASFVFWPF